MNSAIELLVFALASSEGGLAGRRGFLLCAGLEITMVFCTGFLALSEMIRPFLPTYVINLLKNSGPRLVFFSRARASRTEPYILAPAVPMLHKQM